MAQPIPKFYKGVKGFKGGLAEVGERGMELGETKEGKMFLTPETATTMALPKGTNIYTHEETVKILDGMQPAKIDQLIREQRETRKALSGKSTYSLNIDANGWNYSTIKANTRIKHIDKYFRN